MENTLNKRTELIGQTFGKLKILGPGEIVGVVKRSFWLCQCECGNQKSIRETILLEGRASGCGCRSGQRVSSHTPEVAAILDRWQAAQVWRYYQYKAGAKARGYAFELSPQEFEGLCTQDCFYCGAPPSNIVKLSRTSKRRNKPWKYNGIDRRDNTLGYIVTNSVPCCKQCNYAKRALPEGDFIAWIERLSAFQARKRQACLTSAS